MVKTLTDNIDDLLFDQLINWKPQRIETTIRAARLMEVVHNINFEGEYEFDHYRFY